MDEVADVLKSINDNIARLVLVNVALCDELQAVRHKLEGSGCAGEDAVANAFEGYGADMQIEPYFYG